MPHHREDETLGIISKILISFSNAAIINGEASKAKAESLGSTSSSSNKIKELRCSAGCRISSNDIDSHSHLIGTRDGVVDLRQGIEVEGTREQYITKACSANLVDYTEDEIEPWLQFLRLSFPKDTVATLEHLRKTWGYYLTGEVSQEKFYCHFGTGNNGKSVLVYILGEIMGDYAGTAEPVLITANSDNVHSQNVEALRGKRLVVVNEIEQGLKLAESKVKSLTGGDEIISRKMFGSDSPWNPEFKLMLVGNSSPTIREGGKSMDRRLELIKWGVVVADADVDTGLRDKLLSMKDVIFSWMVGGAVDFYKVHDAGIGHKMIASSSIIENSNEYLESEDLIKQFFIEKMIYIGEGYGKACKFKEVHEAFNVWMGKKDSAYGAKIFKKELKNKNYKIAMSNNVVVLKGWRLRGFFEDMESMPSF